MTPEVGRILRKIATGKPFRARDVMITHTRVDGHQVSFCTEMENDPIQRNHQRGRFYEQRELGLLREMFPKGGCFVDIGANVGNHSLYAAIVLGAVRVIPVEPNWRAYRLLAHNVLINGIEDVVDLSRLGVGLSDKQAEGYGMEERQRNLGGAKMLEGQGNLKVLPGDELLAGDVPDMIKIDVEGMEMAALAGLEETISKHRPALCIEVDNVNAEAFADWAESHDYDISHTIERYRANKNHLLRPRETAGAGAKTGTRKTASTAKAKAKPASRAKPASKAKPKTAGRKRTAKKVA